MTKTAADIRRLVETSCPNICQMAIVQRGRTVFSSCWNGYAPTDAAHVMSVTKSVMALLVGIAIDQQKIGGLDDKIIDYFPDVPLPRGEKTARLVTLRHLLSMRAPYKGKGDPWTRVCTAPDWAAASLAFLGGPKGLTDAFDYRTVCLHILSGLLARATGMNTVDFANRHLFAPLGIPPRKNFVAADAAEHKRFMLGKGPRKKLWFADTAGNATPGYGLCISADDLAKIGRLCLGRGTIDGRKILSAAWFDEMTRPRHVDASAFAGLHYGLLWWVVHSEENIYAAIGHSGNVLYVHPARDLAIAVTAAFKPTVADRIPFIESRLLPLVR